MSLRSPQTVLADDLAGSEPAHPRQGPATIGDRNGDHEFVVKGMNAENNAKMIKAATLLLDGAVGEYDSATKLGEVNLIAMPAETPPNLKPLTSIAQAVDSL